MQDSIRTTKHRMDSREGLMFKVFAILGPAAFLCPAPFGRFHHPASALNVNGRLAWVMQESVGFVVFVLRLSQLLALRELKPEQIIACTMFIGHYINRSLIWPLFMMHSLSPSHIIVVVSAATWQYLNGNLQAIAVSNMIAPTRASALIGICTFIFGMSANIWHDMILANLRKEVPGYSVPRGGLYSFVSFPTYFCEWIEWSGYAVFLGQPEGWWFVILEILVMLPRAISGHHWYRNKFGSQYPANRKAVLPFLI